MRCRFTRRDFLGTAAAGLLLSGRVLRAAEERGPLGLPPVKIHKVYVGGAGHAWPKPEFDAAAEIAKFDQHLAQVERQLGDVQFVGGEQVRTPAEAAPVAAKLAEADGVLLIHLSLGTLGLLAQLVNAKRPTVVFSQPFSGHEWMYVPQWQKAGQKVVLVASRDPEDLRRAVALLRVPGRLRRTRVLVVGGPAGTPAACSAQQIKDRLGADLVPVSVQRVVDAHAAVDPKLAESDADAWVRQAKKVLEPPRAEIVKSARLFFAMKHLLEQEKAQAITIRCLGGIPIDTLGYPCLGFSKLCDLGLVGACEADMDSTLTMLLFAYAFGVPGFISDPLIDVSKNAVIHAHCTSATRMDGPAGERAPYLIRTHRDDNRGAALEVEMRLGQLITCAKLANLDTILVSTGTIIEVPDFDDRGCRTQITTQVADARRMQDHWGRGLLGTDMMTLLHRVVFYGDRGQGVRDLAALTGLKVVEEG
jgi:hypothetical protein